MKRRRNLLVALLLVCAMGIGVGYASLTGELTLTSKATVAAPTFDVTFTNAVLSDSEGNVQLADCTTYYGSQAMTLDLTGFEKATDKAVVTVTITNNHEFAVKISGISLTPGNEGTLTTLDGDPYFTYAYDGLAENNIIAAKDSKTFTVTITCNSQNHKKDAQMEQFVLTFDATANAST